MSELQEIAKRIHQEYIERYDGEIQGCCACIAADILDTLGRGEAVAGFLMFGGIQRAHWWVEADGEVLDPMGDDLLSHEKPGTAKRAEEHRDQKLFWYLLPESIQWRIWAGQPPANAIDDSRGEDDAPAF